METACSLKRWYAHTKFQGIKTQVTQSSFFRPTLYGLTEWVLLWISDCVSMRKHREADTDSA
jgi:hypothetical protein